MVLGVKSVFFFPFNSGLNLLFAFSNHLYKSCFLFLIHSSHYVFTFICRMLIQCVWLCVTAKFEKRKKKNSNWSLFRMLSCVPCLQSCNFHAISVSFFRWISLYPGGCLLIRDFDQFLWWNVVSFGCFMIIYFTSRGFGWLWLWVSDIQGKLLISFLSLFN